MPNNAILVTLQVIEQQQSTIINIVHVMMAFMMMGRRQLVRSVMFDVKLVYLSKAGIHIAQVVILLILGRSILQQICVILDRYIFYFIYTF